MGRSNIFRVGFLLLAFWLCGPFAYAATGSTETEQQLIVGRISMKPTSQMRKLNALNTYLEQAFPGGERLRYKAVVVPSVGDMAELLSEGRVDILSETPLAAIELEQSADAEILLHEWKKGVAEYSSILITRKDSGMESLEDLRDQVIAFEDRGSTSGFLLPLAILRQRGLVCVELASAQDTPPPGQVGYIFAQHEIEVSTMVATGQVAAGAMSDLDWNDEDEVPFQQRRQMRIMYRSEPVLRSLLLVRRSMSPEIKLRLIKFFTQMHDSPEGWEAMKKYNKVRRFAPLSPQAHDQLDHARALHQLVRDKIR